MPCWDRSDWSETCPGLSIRAFTLSPLRRVGSHHEDTEKVPRIAKKSRVTRGLPHDAKAKPRCILHVYFRSSGKKAVFSRQDSSPPRHHTHTSAASFSSAVGSDEFSSANAGDKELAPMKSVATPVSRTRRRSTAANEEATLLWGVRGVEDCATKADADPSEHSKIA